MCIYAIYKRVLWCGLELLYHSCVGCAMNKNVFSRALELVSTTFHFSLSILCGVCVIYFNYNACFILSKWFWKFPKIGGFETNCSVCVIYSFVRFCFIFLFQIKKTPFNKLANKNLHYKLALNFSLVFNLFTTNITQIYAPWLKYTYICLSKNICRHFDRICFPLSRILVFNSSLQFVLCHYRSISLLLKL